MNYGDDDDLWTILSEFFFNSKNGRLKITQKMKFYLLIQFLIRIICHEQRNKIKKIRNKKLLKIEKREKSEVNKIWELKFWFFKGGGGGLVLHKAYSGSIFKGSSQVGRPKFCTIIKSRKNWKFKSQEYHWSHTSVLGLLFYLHSTFISISLKNVE